MVRLVGLSNEVHDPQQHQRRSRLVIDGINTEKEETKEEITNKRVNEERVRNEIDTVDFDPRYLEYSISRTF